MMNNNTLQISDLSVILREKKIIDSINYDVGKHEIIAIVGKSGIGKTTLLKALAGLIPINSGNIKLNGELITQPSNNIGLVFQDYFVFPWLNVEKNILLGLKYGKDKLSKECIKEKARNLLKSIDLFDDKNKYPSELSGGMLQRVAFGRALAANPNILLLDEPFGALDLITRLNLHTLIKSIFSENRQSIIMVTHNIIEAVALADKIILLSGTPASITARWHINAPRANDSFLKLTKEQDSIVYEILTELKK